MRRCVLTFVITILACPGNQLRASDAAIPAATDAPKPLTPEESRKRFRLPSDLRIELVASEPLIREPSGVCWDEQGRLFVCELHGYNLEGQYDIDELNKSGKLDRQVRRIPANPRAQQAARKETYGTVKLLLDTDGDGRMDRAIVFADRLPPCYGIVPARGGVIVACAPDIIYLADRDGDGKADVREVLFTGFPVGPLERGINCPQWGPDDWIYFGRGHGGGIISGPHLKKAVHLPSADFRIKADGSAIEPVGGGTGTIGFTFTELGERFVVRTRSPAVYVPPLPWHYLARNPYAAAPSLELDVNPDQRVYPISEPHPRRKRRGQDPGFAKFYTEHYGFQEAAPNGYFTSACSSLVYQDASLPGLRGHLLACEPAQNFVFRGVLERQGLTPKLYRPKGEEKREFLASTDPWFHPIALTHGPNGDIAIVDFYREIIEDYSAIPRYLQQQYGLVNGQNHGRIWRLTRAGAEKAPAPDMSRLTLEQLAKEVAGSHLWRRQTARRMLIERRARQAAPALARLLRQAKEPAAILNVLYTLDALDELKADDVEAALNSPNHGVRVHALRLAERWFHQRPSLVEKTLALMEDPDPAVLLQVALSLGESRDARVLPALARLAREHGDLHWMPNAILSSLFSDRGGFLLAELLRLPAQVGKARSLVEPLCAGIAARRDARELSAALVAAAAVEEKELQMLSLRGFLAAGKTPKPMALSQEAKTALNRLAAGSDAGVRSLAKTLVTALKVEVPAQRQARLSQASRHVGDIKLSVETRLAAVAQLADEEDPALTATLLAALPRNTPRVQEAILSALFNQRDRLPALLDALERKEVPLSLLSAVQRTSLLSVKETALAKRAAAILKTTSGIKDEVFSPYVKALKKKRDVVRGQAVFREKCASCHQAHGVGHAVGPDLTAEFQRAEETIVRDVLDPSETISPGYATYTVETTTGQVFSGLLASESPTSVTLRMAEGQEQIILRKDVDELRALPVSMMPDDLAKVVSPADLADLLAWLRRPPTCLVLLDENQELLQALNEGSGRAEFIATDRYAGRVSLRVTPPQRYSPRLPGWEFRIREQPGPGEYRYLRWAWKSADAHGVMLELAADGRWPPADKPSRRYHAGKNTTGWQSVEVSAKPPRQWTVVTRDLWKDFGDFTFTGLAPTTMGGPALFDRLELLQTRDDGKKP